MSDLSEVRSEVCIDVDLGISVSIEELDRFAASDGSMGIIPDAGDVDYESGASVNLTVRGERSMFDPIADDEIF